MFKCLGVVTEGSLHTKDVLGYKINRELQVKKPYFEIFDSVDSSYVYCTREHIETLRKLGIFIDNYDYDNSIVKEDYFDLNSEKFQDLKGLLDLCVRTYKLNIEMAEIGFKFSQDLQSELILAEMLRMHTLSGDDCAVEISESGSIFFVSSKKFILSGVNYFVSDKHNVGFNEQGSFSSDIDICRFSLYNFQYKLDLIGVDMSMVEDASDMFRGTRVTSVKFDKTFRPRILDRCFYSSQIQKIDFNSFDSSRVESIKEIFEFCDFETIDLTGFNLSNCENISNMFAFCKHLKDIDVSVLDVSNVKSAEGVFEYCESLISFDTNKFNFSNKLVNADTFFMSCAALKSVDLSGIKMARSFTHLLNECISLEKADISCLIEEGVHKSFSRAFAKTFLAEVKGLELYIKDEVFYNRAFEKCVEIADNINIHACECNDMFRGYLGKNVHVTIDKSLYNDPYVNCSGMFERCDIDTVILDIQSEYIDLSTAFRHSSIKNLFINFLSDKVTVKAENILVDCDMDVVQVNFNHMFLDVNKALRHALIDKFAFRGSSFQTNSEQLCYSTTIFTFATTIHELGEKFKGRYKRCKYVSL